MCLLPSRHSLIHFTFLLSLLQWSYIQSANEQAFLFYLFMFLDGFSCPEYFVRSLSRFDHNIVHMNQVDTSSSASLFSSSCLCSSFCSAVIKNVVPGPIVIIYRSCTKIEPFFVFAFVSRFRGLPRFWWWALFSILVNALKLFQTSGI